MSEAQLHFDDIDDFTFGSAFLRDHAGSLISEPNIAIVELIANAYDAGATRVIVKWPEHRNEQFEISDNGTGMTADEFNRRWRALCYDRLQEQGSVVEFPPGVSKRQRIAFGMNGKGRHSAFCFTNSYRVETWKKGNKTEAVIELTDGGAQPFRCQITKNVSFSGHGTSISGVVERNLSSEENIREWIGSKFIVDPSFKIVLNGRELQLTDLSSLQSHELDFPPHGIMTCHHIDSPERDRTTKLRGITWWVNNRMVGHSSWDGLDGNGAILDGRTLAARRYSFLVEADFLKNDIKADWSGFRDNQRTKDVREHARHHIIKALDELLADTRKDRKKAVLAENRKALGALSRVSRNAVGRFVDEVQTRCPQLSQGDLVRTVEIFTKMEESRSGYDLLRRLAACSPNDIDTWNRLMLEWNANSAEIVLGELGKRLDLLGQLQALVGNTTADELHDLQPLFARGLWIFGPEYEAVDFSSNRTMCTLIRTLLGGSTKPIEDSRRPDLVALPDRSIGLYSADSYDDDGEVCGVRKVLVVELKKGGFQLTVDELRQGEDYAQALRGAKHVQKSTEILVYVLGEGLKDGAEEVRKVGDFTKILPMRYETVLKRAHARTFNLQRKLEAKQPLQPDAEVEEVLSEPDQNSMFG
jgi:hypothetical protein